MIFFNDPFFWAFISMFGLVGCGAVVSGSKLGQYPLFGAIVVIIFDLGRVLLVLPFCPQPRFEILGIHSLIGGFIFIVGIIFCTPALKIKPITAPDKTITLQTNGLYGIVRNPIYTGELLWSLGLAIYFRSVIGVVLIPVWWIALLFHIAKEEESLERELGEVFHQYRKKVKGRIIPGLPI
jgi:protein-S-isoprenylcysteine O-methyltransferase Ste14